MLGTKSIRMKTSEEWTRRPTERVGWSDWKGEPCLISNRPARAAGKRCRRWGGDFDALLGKSEDKVAKQGRN